MKKQAKRIGVASIDVSKISKDKLFKGDKGLYCNVVIFFNDESDPDQFGNTFSIAESQEKSERENGKPANYLGNGKFLEAIPKKPSDQDKDDLGW